METALDGSTIFVAATDESGNSNVETATVSVPHDKGLRGDLNFDDSVDRINLTS